MERLIVSKGIGFVDRAMMVAVIACLAWIAYVQTAALGLQKIGIVAQTTGVVMDESRSVEARKAYMESLTEFFMQVPEVRLVSFGEQPKGDF